MIKQGIVMDIKRGKACVMTSDGQFLNIKIENTIPSMGQVFKGHVVNTQLSLYKLAPIAASLLIMITLIPLATLYFKPVTDVSIKINPHIKLEANRWNKIIRVSPLNLDGEKVLKNIHIKNKSIDIGLAMIVEEAKNQNYINKEYIDSEKIITVDIISSKKIEIDLTKFKNKIKKENLNSNIKSNVDKQSKGNVNIIIDKNKYKEFKIQHKKFNKPVKPNKKPDKPLNTKPDKSNKPNTLNKKTNVPNHNSSNNSNSKSDNINKPKNKSNTEVKESNTYLQNKFLPPGKSTYTKTNSKDSTKNNNSIEKKDKPNSNKDEKTKKYTQNPKKVQSEKSKGKGKGKN